LILGPQRRRERRGRKKERKKEERGKRKKSLREIEKRARESGTTLCEMRKLHLKGIKWCKSLDMIS